MKKGVRILGVDDGAFELEDEETDLIGVVYRGTDFIEDVKITSVQVDGEDSTEKLINLYRSCNNPEQIKAVLVDGISFAGFNVVDIGKVSSEIEKPVIAVTPNKPNREDFRSTMERTENSIKAFEKLDDASTLETDEGSIYFQFSGVTEAESREILRVSVLQGLTPEPVRAAHMIGRASLSSD